MGIITKPYSAKPIDFKIAIMLMYTELTGMSGLYDFLYDLQRKRFAIQPRWFVYLVLMFFAASTWAQTPVSGAIAVNTHWTSAESPYLLAGDIVVQNGAVLTIDPGVTVYMGANANLTVQNGSIQALGTSVEPINVLSDKSRLAQDSAAGDWKQWVFNPGTTSTRLDHVLFEHGSGLVVKGSAPVLNYLTIKNHQGAAITIDLMASPSGIGNKATGNSVNGIAVPAGDIKTSIKWGLRGIPYFINSGVVSVGATPGITSITPKIIQQGSTINIDLVGTRLTGLATVQFEKSGLSAKILSGGTDTQASLSVTAGPTAELGKAAAHLLVDAGEVVIADALTVVPNQPILSNLNPSKLFIGQGLVEVEVNGSNFSSQSSIQVNNITIASQYQSATKILASGNTPNFATNLSVKVITPDPFHDGQNLNSNVIIMPVVQGQLVINPATITATKGFTKTLAMTLPYPATAGGITVDLVSSVPTVGSVPTTLTFPAGQTSAVFTLTATDTGNTVITASKSGFVSSQAQVSVVPPPTLTLTPGQLNLGVERSASVTITSSVPAGDSGLNVVLSSSDNGIATVPASLVIPKGSNSAAFTLTTKALGTASITATANEFTIGSTLVKVRPVSINLPTGALVAPGLNRSVPVMLSDPAPAGGLEVTLTSANSATATVPASITVPEGQTSANFTLTGVTAGATSINATAPNYQAATLPVTVETITIGIGNPAVNALSIPADVSYNYGVTLSRPAPTGGVEVNLITSDPGKATVSPASITIAEGQTSGGVALVTLTGVVKGITTLTASAAGLNSAAIPLTITGKPKLLFNRVAVTVGKGLKTYTYEVYVYRQTDNSSYAPNQDLIVNLSSSDTGKASVPTTVTIPAGSYNTYFTVTGVDLTNGVPVTVDATAAGYTAPDTKLAVNTVAPVFTFTSLDSKRSPASVRDDFYISVTTPGAYYDGNQTAVVDLPIDLSIVNGNPASIIAGFYSAQTGGTAITQMLLRKNSTVSDTAYVSTPTVAGSYQVQASATGVATGTSGVVTVTAPELRFSVNSVTVGKGLKTYYYEVSVYRAVNGTSSSGADALTVNLSSSDVGKASVPATVTIPAGSSSTYFYVSGVDLTNGVPVTVDATAAGYTAPATKLAVNTVAPVFTFSSLDSKRSPTSMRDDFSIYVTTPGSNYSGDQTAVVDLPIDLSIVNGNPASIIAGFYSAQTGGTAITQMLLRKNSTVSDTAYVSTPTVAGSYQVQASATGVATGTSGVVTVTAPELRFSRNSVTVGKGLKNHVSEVYVYRAVNGTASSGADALIVNLSSSDAGKANVPATVTIPAGSSSTYFYVTGVDMTNGVPVTVDATAAGYTAPATKLAVNTVAPVFTIYSLDSNRSPASVRDDFYIYVTTPGATYSGSQSAVVDLPIDLSIVNSNPATIVDGFYSAQTGGTAITKMLLRKDNAGSDTAYVSTPTMAGSYQVQASATGVASVTSGVVTVTAPELRFSVNSVTVGKGLNTYSQEVYVYRAVNGTAASGTDALTVNLSCSSVSICKVPATVTIPAGNYYTYFRVEGTGLGNATVTASAVGYNSPPQDLAVNVILPQLNFSGPSNTTVTGKQNVYVYLTTPGATYTGSQTAAKAITVNLTSSAPGVATVPATVTIPIDSTQNSYNTAQLTGVAVGTTTLTASGSGLLSANSNVITINP